MSSNSNMVSMPRPKAKKYVAPKHKPLATKKVMVKKAVANPGAAKRNAQREALAMLLLSKAGDILDDWLTLTTDYKDLRGLSEEDAAKMLSEWLRGLPGEGWDARLPEPTFTY